MACLRCLKGKTHDLCDTQRELPPPHALFPLHGALPFAPVRLLTCWWVWIVYSAVHPRMWGLHLHGTQFSPLALVLAMGVTGALNNLWRMIDFISSVLRLVSDSQISFSVFSQIDFAQTCFPHFAYELVKGTEGCSHETEFMFDVWTVQHFKQFEHVMQFGEQVRNFLF